MFAGVQHFPIYGKFYNRNCNVGDLVSTAEPAVGLRIASTLSRGGRILGQGSFGVAMSVGHRRVLKVPRNRLDAAEEDAWFDWATAVKAEQDAGRVNPYLMVIHELKVGSGLRSYAAEVEWLEEGGKRTASRNFTEFTAKAYASGRGEAPFDPAVLGGIADRFGRKFPAAWLNLPALAEALELVKTIKERHDHYLDLHGENIMYRRVSKGNRKTCLFPVLSDPLS